MNSDIRIKLSFRNHRKTEKLRRRLGGDGVLALLWLWMDAAENRPEGVLTGYDEEDIAIAAGWSGEPEEFISALLDTGWMEKTDGGPYALHDYQEHQPYASGAEERKIKGKYNAYLGHGNLAKARELEDQHPWLAQPEEKTGEPQGKAAAPHGSTHGDPTGPPMAPPPVPPRGSHGGPHAPSPTPTQPPRSGATKASSTSSRTRGSNSGSRDRGDPPSGESPLVPGEPATDGSDHPTPPGEGSRAQPPPCPHEEIIAAYHEILPELPRVKEWPEHRQRALRSRWREKAERQSLEWWRRFFEYVRDSSFLMGRKKDFRADLEWLIRPKNFVKALEGRYHHENEPGRFSATTLRNMAATAGWEDREG